MNAPVPLRQIAVVADEEDFQRVVLARVKELNVSRRELSIEAGLTESYAEKVLCGMKGYGPKSRWGILAAIGYAVIIVEDPAATKRFAQSMAKRDHGKAHRRTRALVMSGRIPWLITKEKARELGANGGKVRVAKQSLRMRSKSARRAAIIRWKGRGCAMKTGKLTHMSMNEFREACMKHKGGETFIYAIGYSSLTKHLSESKDEPTFKEAKGVKQLAMEASDRGEVHLTQKKLAFDLYEYRATKALPRALGKVA